MEGPSLLSIYHASSIETLYSNDQTVLLGCLNDIFDLFDTYMYFRILYMNWYM